MILVVGSTGNLGGIITRMLLEQKQPVRVLVRPQSAYQPFVEMGAQAVLGDLKDPQSLNLACQGIDTVITTANSGFRGGDDTPETVDLQGNHHLIDAAKAAGVKQFIFISTILADAESPVPIMQAKGKTEEYLRACGIPYTIIAPNAFMEMSLVGFVGMPALYGQTVTIVGDGRKKHSFICMHDIAAFILAAIGNSAAINQKLFLGGPQALSFQDAVSIYEQKLARPIAVNYVALGEPVAGMTDVVVQILASFDMFESTMDTTELATSFGVPLTPFERIVDRAIEEAAAGV